MRRAATASVVSTQTTVMATIATTVLGFGIGVFFMGIRTGQYVSADTKVVQVCSIGVAGPSGLRVPAVQTSGGDFATSPGVTGTLVVGQVYEVALLDQDGFASTIWEARASTKTPVGHC